MGDSTPVMYNLVSESMYNLLMMVYKGQLVWITYKQNDV